MSYRCGIGLGMRRVGLEPCEPHFVCDDCGLKYVVRGRGAGGNVPPAWFLDGKGPPKWKTTGSGSTRRDVCPNCKDVRGSTSGGAR